MGQNNIITNIDCGQRVNKYKCSVAFIFFVSMPKLCLCCLCKIAAARESRERKLGWCYMLEGFWLAGSICKNRSELDLRSDANQSELDSAHTQRKVRYSVQRIGKSKGTTAQARENTPTLKGDSSWQQPKNVRDFRTQWTHSYRNRYFSPLVFHFF